MFWYQNGTVTGPNVQVDSPNANSDHNVDDEPEPVITEVPWHVDERALC